MYCCTCLFKLRLGLTSDSVDIEEVMDACIGLQFSYCTVSLIRVD